MHEVGRRAEISRLRHAIGHSADRADCSIDEIVWLRDHGMRVNGPERPRSTQGYGELVIVIGRVLVGMAVVHHLDRVLVVMSLLVMVVFVIGDR